MSPQITLHLPDDSTLDVRPVTPDDRPLLAAGFEGLSERARYLRFMSPTPTLSRSQLAYLSEVDHDRHVALAALDGDTPVAVVRMVTFSGSVTDVDVAITVVEDYQRRGIGTELIKLLAAVARHRGIVRMHFDVLAENGPMLGLLARFGAVGRPKQDSVVHVVLETRVVSPPRVAGSVEVLVDDARDQARDSRRPTNSA